MYTSPVIHRVVLHALAIALIGVAVAQDGGFDAHRLHPAAIDGDLRDPLLAVRPGALAQGDAFGSLLLDYARAPLVRVLESEVGSSDPVVESVVDHLTVANLSAGAAVHERVRLDAHVPLALLSVDETSTVQPPAIGDLRLSALGLALAPQPGRPGLGVSGHLDLPTGVTGRYLGKGGVAGGLRVASTVELQTVTLTADAGVQIDPVSSLDNLVASDRFVAAAAVGWLATDEVGLTLEAITEPVLRPATMPGTGVPVEVVLSARARASSGAFIVGGVAGGITDGAGVPAYRAFLGGGWGRVTEGRLVDIDELGSLRILDECPGELEVVNGWLDDDGCADELGTLSVRATRRGLPAAVQATITGPEGPLERLIPESGLALDAAPGTRWAFAVADGCLRGEGEAIALEGGRAVTLELQLAEAGTVRVEVVDPAGQPVPEAFVAWESTEPTCVPDEVQSVDGRGVLVVGLGLGAHQMLVSAPGYAASRSRIVTRPGDELSRQVILRPSAVRLTGTAIEISDKVLFGTGNAVISAESDGLLADVAAVINAHPAVGRIEVAGHTDSRGSDSLNLELSQRRAEAVREFLIAHGVDGSRLVATGYGESSPLETNRTAEGREANRRVEFVLIDESRP